jgi:hypothetical protein
MKAKRIARRWPLAAWGEYWAPLWDRSQALALINTLVALYLIFQTASLARIIEEINSLVLAAYAFGWAMLIWAIISAIRAPFVIVRQDRELGRWLDNQRVYHEPILVATECFEALDGQTQKRLIFFADAEPNAFVYYTLQLTPHPVGRVGVLISGGRPNEHMDLHERWQTPIVQLVGTSLPADRAATLCVKLQPETRPIICRVYCQSFYVGGPIP